jgi:hypothetical protein
MAGNQNSGGMRPTAPQNNPANVSATGGNGQSGQGQAARYIPGLPYGQGQATMQTQQSAKMSAGPRPSATTAPKLPDVMGLTEPTMRPEEPVTAGLTPYGQPNDPTALGLPGQMPNQDPDVEMVRRFFPAMEFWASQPGASQATKDYIVYLRGTL